MADYADEKEQKSGSTAITGIYSICGYYKNQNEKYFSYQVSSGWCRQIYDKPTDSMFEFILFDKGKELYIIRNKFNDTQKNTWLSSGKRGNFTGNMVGLYSDINHRALWQLIPADGTKMSFKMKCFYDDLFQGWLGYQNDGKWNKLYANENQATVYKFKKTNIISTDLLYSIHGYFNNKNEKYLSYQAATGWCRQQYTVKADSKFQFIEVDQDKKLYYILNKFNDQRFDKWLSFGKRGNFQGHMVGLYTELDHRALWQLLPADDTKMLFKMKCFYDGIFQGWLSYQNDGRWNKLYADEKQAVIYHLEVVQCMAIDLVIPNGIYSMHGYYNNKDEKYLSYETASGWCRQLYDIKNKSRFQFIEVDKNKKLFYILNKFNDARKDRWLSYGGRANFSGSMVGLYVDIKNRAVWKLIPEKGQQKEMCFKIKCFWDGVFRGWLSYQNSGKWNKLYNDEYQATIYKLEK